MHPTDIATLSAATQVTAQLLREAGINLEVQAMDWSTLTSRRAEKKAPEEGGWHIFHTSWIAPDLINPVANIGVSGGGVEKAWFGWPTDPEIEALRQAFARETNPAKQKQLASQVQERGDGLGDLHPDRPVSPVPGDPGERVGLPVRAGPVLLEPGPRG